MNNIFKGAKFGDKFVTRGGSIAILTIPKTYQVMLEDLTEYKVMSDGLAYNDMSTSYDIVSRYQEPIDEKKLDGLANNENLIKVVPPGQGLIKKYGRECFKAGYRKAMEE